MTTPDRPPGDGRKRQDGQEPDEGQAALEALLTWLEQRYPGWLGPHRGTWSRARRHVVPRGGGVTSGEPVPPRPHRRGRSRPSPRRSR